MCGGGSSGGSKGGWLNGGQLEGPGGARSRNIGWNSGGYGFNGGGDLHGTRAPGGSSPYASIPSGSFDIPQQFFNAGGGQGYAPSAPSVPYQQGQPNAGYGPRNGGYNDTNTGYRVPGSGLQTAINLGVANARDPRMGGVFDTMYGQGMPQHPQQPQAPQPPQPPLGPYVNTTMGPGGTTTTNTPQFWGGLESQWQKFSADPSQWAEGTDMVAAKKAFMDAGGYDRVGDPVAAGVPFQPSVVSKTVGTPAQPIHLTDKPHKVTGELVPKGYYKKHPDALTAWKAANPGRWEAYKRSH